MIDMGQSSSKPKLLVVEDDESIRTQMKWALLQDYEVLLAEDRGSALGVVKREKPPVVTLDLGLPPRPTEVEEGFSTLDEILSENSYAKVIIVTGRGEREHALKAIGQGAYDFFYKPIQIDELRVVLSRAFYISQLEQGYIELQKHLSKASFEEMLGVSPQIQGVFSAIRKVATTDAPVLVAGESGTGKELTALAIHRRSSRRENPFAVINCSAIPETLLESELFGHERGAYTGAHVQRKGRIEAAQGGTLFLDEIGELSLPLQVKLLRFLEDHQIERVGGREKIPVNTRVIAATNADLKQKMKDGCFREDLYYRIGVVIISLPALREREEDILLLAKAFLQRYVDECKKRVNGFTNSAINAMKRHSWPGNIRELENRIKRAVIMAEGAKITPDDLELVTPHTKYEGQTLKEGRDALEKQMITRALYMSQGNLSRAAAQLGVSRPTLYELIEKLGIEKEEDGTLGCRKKVVKSVKSVVGKIYRPPFHEDTG
jgi:two-component system NtrC family response regulator